MGVDFLTPIRIPRVALERLISFRKGRLNEVAGQHFRERLGEFFRRYAYDEWYPLTRDELAEYQKNNPDAVPFPWQQELAEKNDIESRNASLDQSLAAQETSTEELEQKGFLDYLSGADAAMAELNNILESINKETDIFNIRIRKQNEEKDRLAQDSGPGQVEKLNNLYKRIAGDIQVFSKKIEEANIRLEKNINDLTTNVLGYIQWASDNQQVNREEILVFRQQIEFLSQGALAAGETYRDLRDIAENLSNQNISMAFNYAIRKYAKAANGLVVNIEEVQSFCLKTLFILDEKFKDVLGSENKTE